MPYDLFLGVPVHRAPRVVEESALVEDGWIPVYPATFATRFEDVYAIGDVTSAPVPRVGAIAEGEARTLAGEEIERRVPWRSGAQSAAVSPVRNCLCAQDDLEPVLRAFAEHQPGGRLRFSTEVTSCEQDNTAVIATLVDRASGAQEQVRDRYAIAADGAQSTIRQQLGVPMLGQENVYDSVNILLNADLRPWTAGRPAATNSKTEPPERPRIRSLAASTSPRFGSYSMSS